MTNIDIPMQNMICNSNTSIGFVYCIEDAENGVAKIGYSKNPFRRLAQLQTANASKLEIAWIIDHPPAFEKFIHAAYSERKVSGEWYENKDGAISRIYGGF